MSYREYGKGYSEDIKNKFSDVKEDVLSGMMDKMELVLVILPLKRIIPNVLMYVLR